MEFKEGLRGVGVCRGGSVELKMGEVMMGEVMVDEVIQEEVVVDELMEHSRRSADKWRGELGWKRRGW